jgi:hypothetical protein
MSGGTLRGRTMGKDTRTDLVAELEAALEGAGAIKAAKLRFVIDEARRGEYHEFKNRKYACGKVVLVGLLRGAAMNVLAKRVEDGEFDEHADADDVAAMARDLKDSPALRDVLGLPDPPPDIPQPPETNVNLQLRLQMEKRTREIADRLRAEMPPGVGFTLFLYDFGAPGNTAYVSTADRTDAIANIREWLARVDP